MLCITRITLAMLIGLPISTDPRTGDRQGREYRLAILSAAEDLARSEFANAAGRLAAVRPTRSWFEWSVLNAYAARVSRSESPSPGVLLGRNVPCMTSRVYAVRFDARFVDVSDGRGGRVRMSARDFAPTSRAATPANLLHRVQISGDPWITIETDAAEQRVRDEKQIVWREPRSETRWIESTHLSAPAERLIVVRANGEVELLDVTRQRSVAGAIRGSASSSAIHVAQNGDFFFVGYGDGTLEMRDCLDGELVASGRADAGRLTHIVSDGRNAEVYSGGTLGLIHRWRLDRDPSDERSVLRPVLVGGRPSAITGLCYLDEGEAVVAASAEPGVVVYDSANGGALLTLPTRAARTVMCIVAAPEGDRLVVGHDDGSITVWGGSPAAVACLQLGAIRTLIASRFVDWARRTGVTRAEYATRLRQLPIGALPIRLACAGDIVNALLEDSEGIARSLEQRLLDRVAWSGELMRVLLDDARWLVEAADDPVRAWCLQALTFSRCGDTVRALERLSSIPNESLFDGHLDERRFELSVSQAWVELDAGWVESAMRSLNNVPEAWLGRADAFMQSAHAQLKSRLGR